MAKRRPKVLVIEQDGAGSILGATLSREGVDVRCTSSGGALHELTEELRVFSPDLVILDLDLNATRDGYAMLRFLRQLDLRLILLADTLEDRLVALRDGVHEALVKPFSMNELLARTRALLGWTKSSDSARRIGDLLLDEAAHTVSRGGNLIGLTPTEFDVLSVLARHPAQILSKGQLLAQVWGFGRDYDPNLVEVPVCSLRKKLEAHGSRMIHTVRSTGYVLKP